MPKRDCRLWVIAVAVHDGCCDLGERYWTPESDKEDANARSLEPGGVSRVVSI